MTNQLINDQTKQYIVEDLSTYIKNVSSGSANKASKMLDGISNATISNMTNGKWENIADTMWTRLQKQVSVSYQGEWKIVKDIDNYELLLEGFDDARMYANTIGYIAEPGGGKTATAKDDKKPNSFLIECSEYFTKRSFLKYLLQKMGIEPEGKTIPVMMESIISHMRGLSHPMIKIDEADKLSDPVLYFFISLYNALEGECGFVITGAPYLETRILDGAKRNKKGYKEILSRLGGKFIKLDKPSDMDVKRIIQANGVTDPMKVAEITNESDGDLRVVKKKVHAHLRKSEIKRGVAA